MKNILIVDNDNILDRTITSLFKDIKDLNIMTKYDGVEAIEVIHSGFVDLLITDLTIPRIDGVDLVKRIRKHPKHKNMKIIILVKDNEIGSSKELENLVDKVFIKEEVEVEDLIETVKRLTS